MDLRFTQEELAFRDEVRTFFKESLPSAIREKLREGRHTSKDDLVQWTRILNKKGWAVSHWPKEYGGTGWTPVQQYIFLDELQQAPAPSPLPFGVSMVGPVIYTFGSDAQKKQFLPRIANLDDWWCQGFSEPGAGSDLASLKTTAKRDGDHYVINGQKTWTTLAQHADWIFVLARTDMSAAKRQEGISFILVDMKTPGITVRPIVTIDGSAEVNEVFFDDVRVRRSRTSSARRTRGGITRSSCSAMSASASPASASRRSGCAASANSRPSQMDGGRPLIELPRFREKLAAVEIELKALEMTQLRVVAAEAKRAKGKPDPASSILKIKGSEIQQATTELLMEVVGPYALPYRQEHENEEGWNEPPIGPDWASTIAPTYFNTRKVSIYGGSNEIQKNIIAKAILGL